MYLFITTCGWFLVLRRGNGKRDIRRQYDAGTNLKRHINEKSFRNNDKLKHLFIMVSYFFLGGSGWVDVGAETWKCKKYHETAVYSIADGIKSDGCDRLHK